jgi:hypothetical protein
MRTKDEVLNQARDFISNPNHSGKRPLWIERIKIEILLDIRDVLRDGLDDIHGSINNISLIR